MNSSRKPNLFLTGMAAFGLLLILSGFWEWAIAGTIGLLVLGGIMLGLTAIAMLFGRRALAKPS